MTGIAVAAGALTEVDVLRDALICGAVRRGVYRPDSGLASSGYAACLRAPCSHNDTLEGLSAYGMEERK